jgi:hypothetical protein
MSKKEDLEEWLDNNPPPTLVQHIRRLFHQFTGKYGELQTSYSFLVLGAKYYGHNKIALNKLKQRVKEMYGENW